MTLTSIPPQIRPSDLTIGEGQSLLLDVGQREFAKKFFRDNPSLRRLRKKDYFFEKDGKYVWASEEDAEAVLKKEPAAGDQAASGAIIPANAKLIQVLERVPYTLVRDEDNHIFAVYYGKKGHPDKGPLTYFDNYSADSF